MKTLIIEDEPKIARALAKGLRAENWTVDVCETGMAGLDMALDNDHDVIILDWMLPEITGLEICQKLRAAQIDTPIIMLTAKGEVKDRVAGLDSGADDYLIKPFSFEELLSRLRALLRRPSELDSHDILVVDDLILNLTTYEVSRAGQPIALSRTEYRLLEYLVRHAGQTLTKESIISHVWNFDADVLDNTVEVYLGYLRNKIDKPFALKPLLKTMRGFGYKIDGKLSANF
jgi:DNA-binding response OmpR family regulator